MEKIPQGRYTKEFREEAARLVIENGMSVGEVSCSSFFAKVHLGKLGEVCQVWQARRYRQEQAATYRG